MASQILNEKYKNLSLRKIFVLVSIRFGILNYVVIYDLCKVVTKSKSNLIYKFKWDKFSYVY